MAFKSALFVCAQALLAQCVLSQSIAYNNFLPTASQSGAGCNSIVESNVIVNSAASNLGNVGLASNIAGIGGNDFGLISNGVNSLGAANGAVLSTATPFINLASVSGGGVLPVTSYSPIAPAGLTVLSDNVIEGTVYVTGELPFLSAVAVEGGLATAGSGAASCGCGDGSIGIVSENVGSGLGLGLAGVSNFGGRGYGRA